MIALIIGLLLIWSALGIRAVFTPDVLWRWEEWRGYRSLVPIVFFGPVLWIGTFCCMISDLIKRPS